MVVVDCFGISGARRGNLKPRGSVKVMPRETTPREGSTLSGRLRASTTAAASFLGQQERATRGAPAPAAGAGRRNAVEHGRERTAALASAAGREKAATVASWVERAAEAAAAARRSPSPSACSVLTSLYHSLAGSQVATGRRRRLACDLRPFGAAAVVGARAGGALDAITPAAPRAPAGPQPSA